MNEADSRRMNQIIKNEIEECFDSSLQCEAYINQDDNVVVLINFLDTEKHAYSGEQMESYKDIIIKYLENSEFDENNFDLDYDFRGSITLSYMA